MRERDATELLSCPTDIIRFCFPVEADYNMVRYYITYSFFRQLIEDYNFDGIDLDWEYPGYTSHSGTPADTENFNLLLRDIKLELDALGAETGRTYGLTAALPCGPANIANIDITEVAKYLTEFNLMSYGMFVGSAPV